MSISTPQAGGNRRPSAKPAAGGKPGAGAKSAAGAKSGTGTKAGAAKVTPPTRAAAAKAAAAARESRQAAGAGRGGRPPMTPPKVSPGINWGPVALFTAVGLLAASIIGFGVYAVYKNGRTWQQKADAISGIVDYRKTEPDLLKPAQHAYGKISYPQSPPVGGKHNPNWQRCQGDVYNDQIPNENAVHALEHGAVWITYNPSLPADQVATLAAKVKGNDYMLMSKYPGLDKPISVQAWGFQLKVESANDSRIDEFIKDLRENASQEAGTPCSSGNYTTKTGPDPVNLGQSANPSGSMSAAPTASAG